MLKIILAEDHIIVRNGIKLLLEYQSWVEVIGESSSGQGVLDLMASGMVPDIVITDINMQNLDGIELIKALKTLYPSVKVIILSMIDNEKYVAQAFQEGCYGYLLKNVTEDELIFALKTVSSNNKYLCIELTQKLLDKLIGTISMQSKLTSQQVDLTLREIEVLHLLADGYTNQQMADKLFLSKRTIEGHRQMLIDKTGSKNTAALIRFAVTNGFLN